MDIRRLLIAVGFIILAFALAHILSGCMKKQDKEPKKTETVTEPAEFDYSEDPMFVYQRIGGTADEFRHWFEGTSLRIEGLPKMSYMDTAPLGIRWKDENGTYLATYYLDDSEIITKITKETIYVNGDSEPAYKKCYERWYVGLKQQGFVDVNPPAINDGYDAVYYKHSMLVRGGKHTAELLFTWEEATNAGYIQQVIDLPN